MKEHLPFIARLWAYVAVGYLTTGGINHLVEGDIYRGVVHIIMGVGLGVVTFMVAAQAKPEDGANSAML